MPSGGSQSLVRALKTGHKEVGFINSFPVPILESHKHGAPIGAILPVSASVHPLKPEPRVAILLGTFHGQHFLVEQLNSFTAQTHTNWEVFASDDGSQDDTRAILRSAQLRWGYDKFNLQTGPCKGFAANFLSLTCSADIEADYFAYSDQDDIWEADKLRRALDWLKTQPAHKPALYCSRTRLVDENNKSIGVSPLFKRPPCFANALMQNVAGGNTMVFNRAARDLLRAAGNKVPVVTHDWWVYLAVSGCGGAIRYDPYPSVRYRQHNTNLVGRNTSWCARAKRILMLFTGHYKNWNDQNIKALKNLNGKLSPESRKILETFMAARASGPIQRLRQLWRSGVHRQTRASNAALYLAALFGKV